MSTLLRLIIPALLLTVSGCASVMNMGDPGAKTVATGSAAGSSSQAANKQLEHCDQTLGTLTLVEDANQPWLYQLTQQYHVQSTVPLLRLIIQQSNCFVIVERGRAFQNMQTERALMDNGELRKTSKMGKGQMVAADYTVSPSVTFSERGTSGGNLGALGWIGAVGSVVAGQVRSQEASTMLLLTDNRSGIQLAAAEGSAKNWDMGLLAGFWGGAAAGGGGFSNTPQGKVLAAAFMDSYNQMVKTVRSYQAQSVEGGLGNGGTLKTN